jgi:hypothetical protein
MIIKQKKAAQCGAIRRVSKEHGIELCLAPARILITYIEPGTLCRAHASELFLELKKDLDQ